MNISIASLDPRRYAAITRGGNLDDALTGVEAALACGLAPVKSNMVVFPDAAPEEIAAMRRYVESRGMALQLIRRFSLERRDPMPEGDTAQRPPPCEFCNRLRSTADGYLKPCLFSEDEIPVNFADIRGSLRQAAAGKPRLGTQCRNRPMSALGG